jgi:hypothetical protein
MNAAFFLVVFQNRPRGRVKGVNGLLTCLSQLKAVGLVELMILRLGFPKL